MKILSGFIVGLLCSMTAAAQSKPLADPLRPFTKCKLEGLKVSERVRYVETARKQREVKTTHGAAKVSVADGYHLAFRFDDLFYDYASIKIEQSDPTLYLQNKDAVISSLKYLSTSDQATPIDFTDKSMLKDFEHYGIDRDRIDVGEVVGTHVLFYDRLRMTVTIYLLNQSDQGFTQRVVGGHRRFRNIEQYRALRDDHLDKYSKCLQKVAMAQV